MIHNETKLLYTGMHLDKEASNAEELPIYHSTAYALKNMDDYDHAMDGNKYFYSRCENPNRNALSSIISQLEGGEVTYVCASGMSAISTVLFGLLSSGKRIIAHKGVYGETLELLGELSKRFSVLVTYVDMKDLTAFEEACRRSVDYVYTEVLTNPLLEVIDIDAISRIAHASGAKVIVDSTFTTPVIISPIHHGADIVIHSLTKYFGGHSDITGGSITGAEEIMDTLKRSYLLMGGCIDPNTAWMTVRSVRTMNLRVRKQMENARIVAAWLEKNPQIRKVNHPSLKSHPQHELAVRLFKNGEGAMISVSVEDDCDKVNRFIEQLQMIQYLGTLGGLRTSFAHPYTAFHLEFSDEELQGMGITKGLLRLSVGTEEAEDIIHDLEQALEVFA